LEVNADNPENKTTADMTAILNTAERSISAVFASHTVYEAGAAVDAFLDCLYGTPKYKRGLCECFMDSLIRYCDNYVSLPSGSAQNVTVVPPEHSPVVMLSACVPVSNESCIVMRGLKLFAARYVEFREPICDAITLVFRTTKLDSRT
jgi:hypothetical protein